MTYHESLWRNAPEGATHFGIYRGKDIGTALLSGQSCFLIEAEAPSVDGIADVYDVWTAGIWLVVYYYRDQFSDIHPRPPAYTTASQLVEAYRKEHGAEIEADVDDFLSFDPHTVLEDSLGNAVYHTIIIEKYLAAERARIEESGT